MTECAAHIHIEPEVAIKLLEFRNKLSNKIHRRSRHTSLCSNWCVIGQFPRTRNFGNVQRHTRIYFNWLNSALLQLSRRCQPILCCLRAQLERRRFHFWPIFISQIPYLYVEPRIQVGDCSLRVEPRVHDPGGHRFDSEIIEQSF